MAQASPDSGQFTIVPEPITGADAAVVLERYVAELAELFPAGFDPRRAAPPEPGDFSPPRGYFLLVRDGSGSAAGCGAVRVLEPGIAEIRRMWISPVLRGQGAGRALLGDLELHARKLGCSAVRLDTAGELGAARALYGSAGYAEIPAYNDNEYARHWFEKVLP
ncbi:GNAT family N-acetyltransferase [Saccharopolyspora sp. MS10]|uniref:GNAT family N-acetyltransferase n=1 Tax=Saccharopolyspora sp. MS10 TaxID=3385973 RepID=UPI0039A09272